MEGEDEEMIEEDTPQEILKSLERHEDKPQPVGEETETINLGTDEEPRSVRIGTTLSPSERTAMIELLKDYKDVFAWLYEDMPGWIQIWWCTDCHCTKGLSQSSRNYED